MPTPLRTRALAIVGLVLLAPLAYGALQGTLTLEAAATRAVVLVVVLLLVERLVLPLVRAALAPVRRDTD